MACQCYHVMAVRKVPELHFRLPWRRRRQEPTINPTSKRQKDRSFITSYVLALEHTVPQITVSLRTCKRNVLCAPAPAGIGREGVETPANSACGGSHGGNACVVNGWNAASPTCATAVERGGLGCGDWKKSRNAT
jgi:hypothetical protein